VEVFDRFWDEFTSAFSRLPVWLPGTSMELGDIGVIDRRGWEKKTTLEALGVKAVARSVESDASYMYASSNAVDISALTSVEAGEAVAGVGAAAGMRMAFKRGGAFVVRAEACRHQQIDNMLEVEDGLRSLGKSDDGWRSRRWVLVSQITTAQPCIVVVAANAGAEAVVEIKGAGGVTNLAEVVSAKGVLDLTREDQLAERVLTIERVPLMWRGKVRRMWPMRGMADLGGDEQRAVSGPAGDPDELVDFDAAALDIPELHD
jgi:hypothetical protein